MKWWLGSDSSEGAHTAYPVMSGQDKACHRQGDDLHFLFFSHPPFPLFVLPCRRGSIKWTPLFPPEWWGSQVCPSFSIFLILSFHPPKVLNVKSHLLLEPIERGPHWLPTRRRPLWQRVSCNVTLTLAPAHVLVENWSNSLFSSLHL